MAWRNGDFSQAPARFFINPSKTVIDPVTGQAFSGGVIPSDRIQAGTHDNKGDLSGWPGVVIEVKDRKAHSWHGYFERLREQISNANAYTGVIICKRPGLTDVGEWMAVMPVTEWFNLMQILEDTK